MKPQTHIDRSRKAEDQARSAYSREREAVNALHKVTRERNELERKVADLRAKLDAALKTVERLRKGKPEIVTPPKVALVTTKPARIDAGRPRGDRQVSRKSAGPIIRSTHRAPAKRGKKK